MPKKRYLCTRKSRSGAVVARWAHNPKVVSSSLASATSKDWFEIFSSQFFFMYIGRRQLRLLMGAAGGGRAKAVRDGFKYLRYRLSWLRSGGFLSNRKTRQLDCQAAGFSIDGCQKGLSLEASRRLPHPDGFPMSFFLTCMDDSGLNAFKFQPMLVSGSSYP